MHELSLAESVIQIVGTTARREGATRVRAVRLAIGQLAAVEVEALRFCFGAVSRGTLADGAALEIDVVPGEGWCEDCQATVRMAEALAACARCGALGLRVTGGTGMRVEDVLIE